MMQARGAVIRRLFLRGSLKHSPHAPNTDFLMFHRRQKRARATTSPTAATPSLQPSAAGGTPPPKVHASSQWYRRVLDADPRMQRALTAASPRRISSQSTPAPSPTALTHVLQTLPWHAALELFAARCALQPHQSTKVAVVAPNDVQLLDGVSALLKNPNNLHCPSSFLLQAVAPSLRHLLFDGHTVDGNGPHRAAWQDAVASLLLQTMGHEPQGMLNAWRTCVPTEQQAIRSPRTVVAAMLHVPVPMDNRHTQAQRHPLHDAPSTSPVAAAMLTRIDAVWSQQWLEGSATTGTTHRRSPYPAWDALYRAVWDDLFHAVQLSRSPAAALRRNRHGQVRLEDEVDTLRYLLANGQEEAETRHDSTSVEGRLAGVTAMVLMGMRSPLHRARIVALWLLFVHRAASVGDVGGRLQAVHAALLVCTRDDASDAAASIAWAIFVDATSGQIAASHCRSTSTTSIKEATSSSPTNVSVRNGSSATAAFSDALVQLCQILTRRNDRTTTTVVHGALTKGFRIAVDVLQPQVLLGLTKEVCSVVATGRNVSARPYHPQGGSNNYSINRDAEDTLAAWSVMSFAMDVEKRRSLRHSAMLGLRDCMLRAAFPLSLFSGGSPPPSASTIVSLFSEHRVRVALQMQHALRLYASPTALPSSTVVVEALLASWSRQPTLANMVPPSLVVATLLTQEPSLWGTLVAQWQRGSERDDDEPNMDDACRATTHSNLVDRQLLHAAPAHLITRLWVTLLRHRSSRLAAWLFDQSTAGAVSASPSALVDAALRDAVPQHPSTSGNSLSGALFALVELIPRDTSLEPMVASSNCSVAPGARYPSLAPLGNRVIRELCGAVARYEANSHRISTTAASASQPQPHSSHAVKTMTSEVIAALSRRCRIQPWRTSLSLLAHCTAQSVAPPFSLFQAALISLGGGAADDHRWRVDVGLAASPSLRGTGDGALKAKVYTCNVRGLHHEDLLRAVPFVAPSLWQHAVGVVQQVMAAQTMRRADRRWLLRSTSSAVLEAASEGGASDAVARTLLYRLATEHGVYVTSRGDSGPAPSNGALAPSVTVPLSSNHAVTALQELLLAPHHALSIGATASGVWERAVALVCGMGNTSLAMLAANAHRSTTVGEAVRRTSMESWYGASCLLSAVLAYNATATSAAPPSRHGAMPVSAGLLRRPLTVSRSTAQLCFAQFGKSGAWQQAMVLAAALTQQPSLSPHAWPSAAAYGSCLSAARHARRWDAALRVFDSLHQAASPPDGAASDGAASAPNVVEVTFAHIAEFVATLMDPLGTAPTHAVQLVIERWTDDANGAGAGAHMKALITLLRSSTQMPSGQGLVVSQGTHGASTAALEVYLALLDASTNNRRGVWLRAMEAFGGSIGPLPAASAGDMRAAEVSGHADGIHVPSARSVLSLLTILRRERQWLAALGVYALSLRLLGSTDAAAEQLRQWDTRLTYTTVATICEHAAAWRSALSIFRRHAARVAERTPSRSAGQFHSRHRTAGTVDHRVLDRATHAILAHAPAQWAAALSLMARYGGQQHGGATASPPPHALELMVRSADVPMSMRIASFDHLLRAGSLPVALTHNAALDVLSLVEDMLSAPHDVVSSFQRTTSPMAVLQHGIRNVMMRVRTVEDPTVSKPLPIAFRLRYLRVYYESRVFALWAATLQPTRHSSALDADEATHDVDRLLAVYRQQAAAVSSSPRCDAPIPAIQLQRVGVVLDRVLGDAPRAAAIRNWLNEAGR